MITEILKNDYNDIKRRLQRLTYRRNRGLNRRNHYYGKQQEGDLKWALLFGY